jgi:hypothetical protein
MKTVIALSALAGVALTGAVGAAILGPRLIHARNHAQVHVHTVTLDKLVSSGESWDGQEQCRFEVERSFTEAVGSGDDLHLTAGSGSLDIVGIDGLGEVRAVARACASHEEFLEDLFLTSDMTGSTLRVETHHPEMRRGWSGGNRYARLDLRMEVPAGMAARIQDGSGEMELANLGALTVQDGSGGIVVQEIQGAVTIDDGSGEIQAFQIQGPLSIDDGSGEIEVHGVVGTVEIDDSSGEIVVHDMTGDLTIDDSSGEIDLDGIGGSVTISDGSGEIDAQNVEGTFLVLSDGSGSIAVDGVGGDFIVESDGGGSISHSDVVGTVRIPKRKRDR